MISNTYQPDDLGKRFYKFLEGLGMRQLFYMHWLRNYKFEERIYDCPFCLPEDNDGECKDCDIASKK